MIVLIRKEEATAPTEPTPMADQSTQCPLLALPPELRNHIWSYLLIQNNDPEAHHVHLPNIPTTRRFPSPSQQTSSSPPNITSTSTSMSSPTHHYRRLGSSKRISAQILRTCRQIHAEGTSMLYGANVFDAHSSLLTSLPALNLLTQPARVTARPVTHPAAAKRIRRFFLHVRLDTDPRFTRSQVASAFTGVAELELEVFQSSYGTCDFSVLALFEDVRDVGLAIVKGSVGDGRYAAHLCDVMQSPAGSKWEQYHERYVGGDSAWDAWTNGNR